MIWPSTLLTIYQLFDLFSLSIVSVGDLLNLKLQSSGFINSKKFMTKVFYLIAFRVIYDWLSKKSTGRYYSCLYKPIMYKNMKFRYYSLSR